MEKEEISHIGTIVAKGEGVISVAITSVAGCVGCSVKSACNASNSKEKIIDVYVENFREDEKLKVDEYRVGQQVEVFMSADKGLKATLYGYIIPFVLFVVSIVLALVYIQVEWISAVIALAVLLLYYLSLKYLFHNNIRREFTFRVRPVE